MDYPATKYTIWNILLKWIAKYVILKSSGRYLTKNIKSTNKDFLESYYSKFVPGLRTTLFARDVAKINSELAYETVDSFEKQAFDTPPEWVDNFDASILYASNVEQSLELKRNVEDHPNEDDEKEEFDPMNVESFREF